MKSKYFIRIKEQYSMQHFVNVRLLNIKLFYNTINNTRRILILSMVPVLFQFVVIGSDGRRPPCETPVSVSVSINRNPNGPYFQPTMYTVRISEYESVNSEIVQVFADDDDPAVSPGGRLFYRFPSSNRNDPYSFFTVSPTTGIISVSKQLTTDDIVDEFTVSTVDSRYLELEGAL